MRTDTFGILLCAGFGTRLRPLTLSVPKPAVPFLGHPMVWYAMRALKEADITTLAANVHHLPDTMSECLGDCARDLGLPGIRVCRETDGILGTGGGARVCVSCLPRARRYVVYHCDVLCGASLDDAIDAHVRSGCGVTIVVAPRPHDTKLGMIGVDARGRVARIREWFRSDTQSPDGLVPACFTGIHIIEHDLINSIEYGRNVCLVTKVYRRMLEENGQINACMTDGFFADIGTPETYFDARARICRDPGELPGVIPEDCVFSNSVEDWERFCHTVTGAFSKETK